MDSALVARQVRQRLGGLAPRWDWIATLRDEGWRPDVVAGIIGAILVLPQALALAALAGMPPEYGIYTSIIPVVIAALLGSSWHALSGPNTAVCVMLAASVAPFAATGSPEYIGYVLLLTLMVGGVQLVIGLARWGRALDFISYTVVTAVVVAVALTIVLAALVPILGLDAIPRGPFLTRLVAVSQEVTEGNPYAVRVGLATVVAGVLARRFCRRYALLVAAVVGTGVAWTLEFLAGPDGADIAFLGALELGALPFSVPAVSLDAVSMLDSLSLSALSIAFLGLMQTVVIARALAAKSGQSIDADREIAAQGVANLVAPFVSGFAGSASFNRSAANLDAGARTPMAAVFASAILALLVFAGASIIAKIPMAAIAGLLFLVGIALFDPAEIKRALRSKEEVLIFAGTLGAALGFGLNTGVFTGLILSLTIYLWHTSMPNTTIEEYEARNGWLVQSVTIDGNLFFGSWRHVERSLPDPHAYTEPPLLLVRTDHLTYMDVAGAAFIADQVRERRRAGGDAYVYVSRQGISDALSKAGFMAEFGEEHLIYRGANHPMKEVLYPYQIASSEAESTQLKSTSKRRKEETVETLAKRLRTTRYFGSVPQDELTSLLETSPIQSAVSGEILVKPEQPMSEHLVLLEGELEVQRIWSMPSGNDRSHTWMLRPDTSEGGFALLSAASNRIRVRAVTDARYLWLDADVVDGYLAWEQQLSGLVEDNPDLRHRVHMFKHVNVFHQLPVEHVREAFERMSVMDVEAGDTIVEQGETGDKYYLVEDGQAEVIRTDPFTDETAVTASLGPGDGFGEEALVQSGYRNATIKMTTPGRLLVMDKADFDELLRPALVSEVDPEEALDALNRGAAQLVDCRYDMEYEESRIPGALFVPLDQLRGELDKLDPSDHYIVYCRSGRRSKAAAFLLRERNIDAVSLAGGIKNWPYEVDAEPVEVT